MSYIKLLANLVTAITALPADERGKAIHNVCQTLHSLEQQTKIVTANKVTMLDDLDLDTLKRFHRSPREHWLEGAAVGKLLEGSKLGYAEREILESFASRQQEKWPRTCEALLRVLGQG